MGGSGKRPSKESTLRTNIPTWNIVKFNNLSIRSSTNETYLHRKACPILKCYFLPYILLLPPACMHSRNFHLHPSERVNALSPACLTPLLGDALSGIYSIFGHYMTMSDLLFLRILKWKSKMPASIC